MTAHDILTLSPKFWALQHAPELPHDIASFAILSAHVNLTTGTLVRYLEGRDDLKSLVESLLRLETVGVFLLSERGHGLDSFNIETTATLVDGGFILNTPREEAAK